MKNDNKNCHWTPPTNRGVVMTYRNDVFLLFDWLQGTFFLNKKNKSIYDIFFELFGVDINDVLINEKSAHFGYDTCYSYRNICIFCGSREDMGYHLYMTGSACRDFEELGLQYDMLFRQLSLYNIHYTRIDISFDDFTGKYFPLKKIRSCVLKNCVIGKFRSSIQFLKTDLKSTDDVGHTIWFGSRSSDIQFVFYDKLKERIYNANCEIDLNISSWNRFEMRFKNNYADSIVLNFLYNGQFINYLYSLINNYISFRVPGKDSVRSRWKLCSWWSEFLQTTNKVKFQSRPVEYDIVKKRSWLMHSCSYSAFITMLSDIKDLSTDEVLSRFLFDFLKNGSSNINDLSLQKLNQYRIKNNLVPINRVELDDFIKTIKDVIIQK